MTFSVFHGPGSFPIRPWAGRLCLLLAAILLPLAALDAAERERSAESALAWLVLGISAVAPAFSLRGPSPGRWNGGWTSSLVVTFAASLLGILVGFITGNWWWMSFSVLLLLTGIASTSWRNGSLFRGCLTILLPGLFCIGLPGGIGHKASSVAVEFCLQSVSHAARMMGLLHAVEDHQILSAGPPIPADLLCRGAASLPIWLAGCTAIAIFQRRATAVLMVHQSIAVVLWAMLMSSRGVALLTWPALHGNRQGMELWLAPQELPFLLAGTALWLSGDALTRILTAPSLWFGLLPDERRRFNPLTRFWNSIVVGEHPTLSLRSDSEDSQLRTRGDHRGRRGRRAGFFKRVVSVFKTSQKSTPAMEGIE